MKGTISSIIMGIFVSVIFFWLFIFVLGPAFSEVNSQSGLIFSIAGIAILGTAIAGVIRAVL